jgi:adenylate kinase family enzyme
MQQTFIFIGRSGCGKGTQAKLLMDKLRTEDSGDIFYLETGQRFRDFVKEPNYTSGLSYEVMKKGDRQPDFLAAHIWSHVLIGTFNGRQHLFIDGTPRSKNEALILDTAIKFYNLTKPFVVYFNVSNDWARERLMERGRADDKGAEGVEKRLAWFERDVLPAVEYYREHPDYHFLEINGEQSIEDVHKELISKITSVS